MNYLTYRWWHNSSQIDSRKTCYGLRFLKFNYFVGININGHFFYNILFSLFSVISISLKTIWHHTDDFKQCIILESNLLLAISEDYCSNCALVH